MSAERMFLSGIIKRLQEVESEHGDVEFQVEIESADGPLAAIHLDRIVVDTSDSPPATCILVAKTD